MAGLPQPRAAALLGLWALLGAPRAALGAETCACDVAAWTPDTAVPGYNVLCVEDADTGLSVTIFPGGAVQKATTLLVNSTTVEGFRAALTDHDKSLEAASSRLFPKRKFGGQPWGLFTEAGERVSIPSKSLRAGTYLAFGGGQWAWPGIRVGFEREVVLTTGETITLRTMALSPVVFLAENVINPEEANGITSTAEPRMEKSVVKLKDQDIGKASTEWRTSSTVFLPQTQGVFLNVSKRVAALTRVPREHQERGLQVLRYDAGEYYVSHHDFFDPKDYKKDQHVLGLIDHGKRNRFVTALYYMSDAAGGHTIFPRADGLPMPRTFADCEQGLKVYPKLGSLVIFYNLLASGNPDFMALHGACPPRDGTTKWAANNWIWNAANVV
jgi:prolyl 4-hydroxylase